MPGADLDARRTLAADLARSAVASIREAGMGAQVIGSLARGRFLAHSDVDLLVDGARGREAEAWRIASAAFGEFPYDLAMAHRLTLPAADLMRAEAVSCAPYATVGRRAAILRRDLGHLAEREVLAADDDPNFLRDMLAETRVIILRRVARRVRKLLVSLLADTDGDVPLGPGEREARIRAAARPAPASGRPAMVSAATEVALLSLEAWERDCPGPAEGVARALAAEGSAVARALVPALLAEAGAFAASDAARAAA